MDQQNRLTAHGQDVLMVYADKTLDIKGLVQPRPAIVIEATMVKLGHGQILSVITNDAHARESIPALCSHRGYSILETTVQGGTFYFTIQK
jgi:TusA-related sulfurtransferase